MAHLCTDCGQGTMQETIRPEHVEDVGGIRVRLLHAVTERRCAACGEVETTIPDMRGLTEAVAMARALEPIRLGADDLKLMRRALRMNQRDFAEHMSVTPETISRWEAGAQGIGGDSEKSVRYGVCALLAERQPLFDYDPAEITRMKLRSVREVTDDDLMCFYRVNVRRTREIRGQVWEPQECLAA